MKRLGRDADNSRAPSVEIKNEWSYTSTSPICLHGLDRYNLFFTQEQTAIISLLNIKCLVCIKEKMTVLSHL
jgi:hypothetical protein